VRFGRVLEVGVREVTHKGRDFWSHSVLCFEMGMGIAFEDKSFEETPVEIETFAFLDSEVKIVDLRA
jgi:hypothetical protein